MNIKILVAYHKPSPLIASDIFLPIHVGKKLSNVELNIQGDDSGDNISEKNGIYCEMTALYWAWKNLDADYIGLCHYRRFFTFERYGCIRQVKSCLRYLKTRFFDNAVNPGAGFYYVFKRIFFVKKEDDLKKKTARFQNDLIEVFNSKKIDFLAPVPFKLASCSVEQFFSTIGRDHLALLKKIVQERHPDFYPYVQKTLNGYTLYPANMFIMKKGLFDQYAETVFDILFNHERLTQESGWSNDVLSEKSYARIPGYLAEILTSSYILKLIQEKQFSYTESNTFLFIP